jgi:hypothetical protein
MIEALFVVALLAAVRPAQRLTPRRRALSGEWSAMAASAILLAGAMALAPGPLAGILSVPWLVVTLVGAALRIPGIVRRPFSIAQLADGLAADAAATFLAVGATWAVVSRLGLRPLGLDDRIVLLTAVHFHVAGCVLILAGELLRRRRPSRRISAALALLVAGIPMTAAGFIGIAPAGFVGAWLVSIGGFVIGVLHVRAARRGEFSGHRVSAAGAGAALLVSMPLAAAWATAQSLGVAFLPISAMAAIHGGLNVLGFALPVVHAWRGEPR